jgi:hypothetical protein
LKLSDGDCHPDTPSLGLSLGGEQMFIEFHLLYRYIPGSEEFDLPYRLDTSVLDDAFDTGGLPLLESVMDTAIGMMFDKLKGELMKPYQKEAEKLRNSAFGPLAVFLKMGPKGHEVIKNLALEDHEKGKGE